MCGCERAFRDASVSSHTRDPTSHVELVAVETVPLVHATLHHRSDLAQTENAAGEHTADSQFTGDPGGNTSSVQTGGAGLHRLVLIQPGMLHPTASLNQSKAPADRIKQTGGFKMLSILSGLTKAFFILFQTMLHI